MSSRHGTPPAPTAYRPCVGAIIRNRQGRIWIGRRAEAEHDAEGTGLWWQMPQGGIDAGEDPHVAVVREVREETGIVSVTVTASVEEWLTYDVPSALMGKAWGGRFRGQRQKWFLLDFHGHDAEVALDPLPGHVREFDAWRWAGSDEVIDAIVPFKRPVYARVLEWLSAQPGRR
jgi:putative (di)nucleoside polyphosphate hydrolase